MVAHHVYSLYICYSLFILLPNLKLNIESGQERGSHSHHYHLSERVQTCALEIASYFRADFKEIYVSGMNDEVRSMLKGLNNEYFLSYGDNFVTRLDAIKDAVEFAEEWESKAASLDSSISASSTLSTV